MSKVALLTDHSKCCGCGACSEVCPKNAITMAEDEYGFLYPQINDEACISCNKCVRSCALQSIEVKNSPLKTYAAVANDKELLQRSASGGAFASIALSVLEDGGVVFGAAFDKDMSVKHIFIENSSDLYRLQGSKYVQSNTTGIYSKVKEFLNTDRKVLFSGTPCQVASLYGYLGREYDNLLTVDLICHGVPSVKMFESYLETTKNNSDDKIESFTFRDKKLGWGINGRVSIRSGSKVIEKKLWQSSSSYLYYFTKGYIYRDSCYKCKYACSSRPGDITIGDYWGIEKSHPEYINKNSWNEKDGISVIIANSETGEKSIKEIFKTTEIKDSDFSKASSGNSQLRNPTVCPENRTDIINLFADGGWSKVEKRFNDNIGFRRYSSQIKHMIPESIKKQIKKLK